MPATDDYFIPEKIDEQIDQLAQNHPLDNTNEEALVSALHSHYQSPPQEEEKVFLRHARQRILASKASTDDSKSPRAALARKRSPQKPRSRLVHMLQGLAAVLAVTMLVAGWLVITQSIRQPAAATLAAQKEDLYIVHHNIAYHLDGQTGKAVWQHPVPTRAQSNPGMASSCSLLVADQVVYVLCDFDVYALKADTGTEIWHKTATTPQPYFAFSVDSKRVYLYSLNKTFSALNAADGSLVWQNTNFHTENGYGFTVTNGTLYTMGNVGNSSQLYALNAATGNVRWHFPLNGFAEPIVTQGIAYIASENTVFGLDEQTGKQLLSWTVPIATDLSDVHLLNGILYVNTIDPQAKILMGENPDLRTIFAIDAQTGKQLWASGQGYTSFNVAANGLLLTSRVHDGKYSLAGFDVNTGKVAWDTPFSCPKGTVWPQNGQPACGVISSELTNGKWNVLESLTQAASGTSAASSQRSLTAYTLDPRTGKVLASHQLPSASDWNDALPIGASNGRVYLQINIPRLENTITYTDYAFAAYSFSDGSKLWRFDFPPFPKPTSANVAPGTSQAVLAP